MKKRNVFLLTLTLAGAAFVTLNTTDANAQGRRNRGGQNGAGGANGGQNGGGFGGQNGFGGANGTRGGQFGTMRGVQHDPTRTALPILLKREDVITEISLSQKQGEDFAAEEKTEQDALTQKMQDARKAMQTPAPAADGQTAAPADGQAAAPTDRRAQRTAARQKMTEMMTEAQAAQSDAIEKKAETILRPEQFTRIQQLDLQWRGPLALTVKKIGDKFNLTAEQKTSLADLLKKSQTEQQAVVREAMTAMRPARGGRRGANGAAATPGAPSDPNAPAATPGATPGTPGAADATAAPAPAPLTPEEIQAKMTDAIAKADKIRLDYDAKALAVLTDAQKEQWKAATGAKFTFRQATN